MSRIKTQSIENKNGNNFKLTNWWDLFFNWDNAILKKTLWG
tara:strand:+ start:163 stop:285 length:123 start_codon:yes stop_codon:yes gene_type:complete